MIEIEVSKTHRLRLENYYIYTIFLRDNVKDLLSQ